MTWTLPEVGEQLLDRLVLAVALSTAPFGTVVYDRDGDEWTKKHTGDPYDQHNNWYRTDGGWASASEVAAYAPLTTTRPVTEPTIEQRLRAIERSVAAITAHLGIEG